MPALLENFWNRDNPDVEQPKSILEWVGLGKNDPYKFARMQAIANGLTPTIGAPRNPMDGVPEAAAFGLNLQRQKQQDALAEQERADEQAALEANSAADALRHQQIRELIASDYPEFAPFANVDPDKAWEMASKQKMRSGEPVSQTSDQKNYSTYVIQEMNAARNPMSFNDWMLQSKRAGATNVTVGGAPRPGTLSQDYAFLSDAETGEIIIDPDTNLPKAAPVPGTPAAQKVALNAEKESMRDGLSETASDVVTNAAQRAREAAAKQDFGPRGTTTVANLPFIGPSTDSAEVVRQVDVLKSMASAGNLNAMRQASPTGGALGNVTERELALLADMAGALDPNSPNFLRDLEDYERTILRTIHGHEEGDAIYESNRSKDPNNTANQLKQKYGLE